MSWGKDSLDNIVTFQRGFDLPKEQFKRGEYPVVGSTSIIGYHNEYKVKAPGVVTGRSGTLGYFQYLKEDFWAHNTCLWVKDFKSNDSKFLYYLFQTLNFSALNSGASVPTLNRNVLTAITVEYPKDLTTQQRIAEILSAYDDLIENNLKRIKLLEEAAQNIYKEWFVNFRFPGSEHTEFINGLPKGWERKSITDMAEISGGGTPSTKEAKYWDNGGIIWFSPTDLSKNNSLVLLDSEKKITEDGLNNSSAKLLPPRTILMSSRATIGLFGIINKPCSTNQGFINIAPRMEELRYYLLFNLLDRKQEIINRANGSTFKEISKKTFRELIFVTPHYDVLNKFHSIIDKIIKQIENCETQNQKLKEARDILLPRLMNRTVEV